MSEGDLHGGDFERRTRTLLEESIARLDGRTRSRLNRARQRAMEEYAERRTAPWRRWFVAGPLLPAGAVAAAALVAVTLWIAPRSVGPGLATYRGGEVATAFEDLELLADGGDFVDAGEALEFDFLEWAAAEAEAVGT